MTDTSYDPAFEVEHSYAGFSVVARPGVGPGDESTTVDQVFKSREAAQDWIQQEGRSWAQKACSLPGADIPHRSL